MNDELPPTPAPGQKWRTAHGEVVTIEKVEGETVHGTLSTSDPPTSQADEQHVREYRNRTFIGYV